MGSEPSKTVMIAAIEHALLKIELIFGSDTSYYADGRSLDAGSANDDGMRMD
jgi:hypothetical protein